MGSDISYFQKLYFLETDEMPCNRFSSALVGTGIGTAACDQSSGCKGKGQRRDCQQQ